MHKTDTHEEARKIELHDADVCLGGDYFLEGLNLLVVELQARIVGPQQLHVVMAAEDAQGNETVISLAYHGSFTVWWVDWSPDLEAYEEEDAEDQDDKILGNSSFDLADLIPEKVVASWKDEPDANGHPV